jgi:hypothetical protein
MSGYREPDLCVPGADGHLILPSPWLLFGLGLFGVSRWVGRLFLVSTVTAPVAR